MLELVVFDGEKNVTLQFEHSLLSLSKWEALYKKPFLSTAVKTSETMIDYYQMMLLDGDRNLVLVLAPEQLEELWDYINDSQTASSVPTSRSGGQKITVTSELIYFWFVALQIPFWPTETWHVNRIMMLIQITNHMQHADDPKNKRSDKEIMTDWAAENERRKKLFNTTG